METIELRKNSNQRDFSFDVARSICILEVVCLFHMTNYLNSDEVSPLVLKFLGNWTAASLAVFTFMSGFFLGRYVIDRPSDVLHFYVNRFKRFWILYFIASFLLYLVSYIAGQPWYPSLTNLVLSLVGLTIFFPPLPPTMWYMVMLMFFYFLTPFVLYFKKSVCRAKLGGAFVLIFMILYSYGWVDNRVLNYFPFYVIGLCCTQKNMKALKEYTWSILLVCLIFLLICVVWIDLFVPQFLIMLIGGLVIMTFCFFLSKNAVIRNLSNRISFASMAMYFFHRHFFLAAVIIWNLGNLQNVRSLTMPIWFCVLVVCPIIVSGCFCIQKVYNLVMKRITT